MIKQFLTLVLLSLMIFSLNAEGTYSTKTWRPTTPRKSLDIVRLLDSRFAHLLNRISSVVDKRIDAALEKRDRQLLEEIAKLLKKRLGELEDRINESLDSRLDKLETNINNRIAEAQETIIEAIQAGDEELARAIRKAQALILGALEDAVKAIASAVKLLPEKIAAELEKRLEALEKTVYKSNDKLKYILIKTTEAILEAIKDLEKTKQEPPKELIAAVAGIAGVIDGIADKSSIFSDLVVGTEPCDVCEEFDNSTLVCVFQPEDPEAEEIVPDDPDTQLFGCVVCPNAPLTSDGECPMCGEDRFICPVSLFNTDPIPVEDCVMCPS